MAEAKPTKSNDAKDSKAHWNEKRLSEFLGAFQLKDRPQGCKEAQLRAKHKVYGCHRGCGKYFTSSKEESDHYKSGNECPNHLYNRKDIKLNMQPTPPLEEVSKKVPFDMDIDTVFEKYKKNGIDLPYKY